MTDKTIEFINKAKEIHGDKYDYSKTIYENNLKEVIIICKEHGEFLQLPKTHKRGSGCNNCSLINMANKKILKSKEKFFTDIKIKDNENRWNYIKAINEFNGTNNIITLICNGCKTETKRTPVKHLTEFQHCKYKCFTINKIDETSFNKLNIINNQEIDIQNIIEEWKIIPSATTEIVKITKQI